MKKVISSSFLTLLIPMLLAGQPGKILQGAFESSDFSVLLEFCKSNVFFTLGEEEQELNPEELKLALDSLVKDQSSASFSIKHEGGSDEESFLMGELKMADVIYRLNIVIENNLIAEISLDEK